MKSLSAKLGAALLASTALTHAAFAADRLVNFAAANTVQADVSLYAGYDWIRDRYDTTNQNPVFGGSGRANVPFANQWNLEFEASAVSFKTLYDETVSQTGLFAHLYFRDPRSYAAGIFAGYTDPLRVGIYSIGAEAQLYLGNLILYGQGSVGRGTYNCSSCTLDMWQARANGQFFLSPTTSLAADAMFTRFTYNGGYTTDVTTAALTATQQLDGSPFAFFLQGRFDRTAPEGGYWQDTISARAGAKILVGPAGTTLWSAATTGAAMDALLVTPYSCFVGTTAILMADGSVRPINAVRVGDEVLGENGEVNRVVEIETPLLAGRKLYGFNGGAAFVTAEHPFKTREGWKSIDPEATFAETRAVEVSPLRVGSELVTLASVEAVAMPVRIAGGRMAPAPSFEMVVETAFTAIEAIAAVEADPSTRVYNLRLDGNHTYFADGYLVHNK